jgi:hypothetical protein
MFRPMNLPALPLTRQGNPAGASNNGVLKLDFDRRLMPQFRGSGITSRRSAVSSPMTCIAPRQHEQTVVSGASMT